MTIRLCVFGSIIRAHAHSVWCPKALHMIEYRHLRFHSYYSIENFFHVVIHPILAVCRSLPRGCSSGGRGTDSGAQIESDERCVPCMRTAIDPCAWPLHAPTCRSALPEETCASVSRGAPLCVRYPWMSAHHLCGTLPDAHARVRPSHTAPSRGPHRGRLRERWQSRCAVGQAPGDADQSRYEARGSSAAPRSQSARPRRCWDSTILPGKKATATGHCWSICKPIVRSRSCRIGKPTPLCAGSARIE